MMDPSNATPRRCFRCGIEIPAARLAALPDTQLCIQCSEAVGGDYEVRVTPKKVGKAGKLKLRDDPFGFTVRKTPRRIKPLKPPEPPLSEK